MSKERNELEWWPRPSCAPEGSCPASARHEERLGRGCGKTGSGWVESRAAVGAEGQVRQQRAQDGIRIPGDPHGLSVEAGPSVVEWDGNWSP